jgi:hypothetical protein
MIREEGMVKLGLRLATLDDSSALAAVHVAAFQRAYRGILPDSCLRGFTVERRTELLRRFLATDPEGTYAADLNGQIVGFLTLGSCRDSDLDHKTTGEV